MSLYDFPDRNLDPPEDRPPVCFRCGEGFNYGDPIFRDDRDTYCLDCFLDWAYDLLDTSPEEMAERLGFDLDKQGKY